MRISASRFVPSIEVPRILAEMLRPGANHNRVDELVSGTLTQKMLKRSIGIYGGYEFYIKEIYGEDTDADDGESVVFMDAFTYSVGVVYVTDNITGIVTVFNTDNLSLTGFDYHFPVNNKHVTWHATGVDIYAV